MSKADKMFEELGFHKNQSECYSEEKGHLLYEKSVMNDTDIFMVRFENEKVLYTSLHFRVMWMTSELVVAIHEKTKELGWI